MTSTLLTLLATAPTEPLEFYQFYAANLRTGLFSGFLTLSGFLLAMKTLVVIQLRKELYDTKFYRTRVVKLRALNGGITVYGPLRRFGLLLVTAIALSLTTSVAQFTVGLVAADWAAAICLSLAGLTALVLLVALAVLRNNLGDLFLFWEEEAEEKIKAEAPKPS